jgi:hypothetical protein
MIALVLTLAVFAFVGIFMAHRLDRRDRAAERSQYATRLDIFPRKPGCRCRLCKEAAAEYEAAS